MEEITGHQVASFPGLLTSASDTWPGNEASHQIRADNRNVCLYFIQTSHCDMNAWVSTSECWCCSACVAA